MDNNSGSTLKSKIIRQQQKQRIVFAVIGALLIAMGLGTGAYPMAIIGALSVLVYFLPAIRGGFPKDFVAGLTLEEAEADLLSGTEFPQLTVGKRFILVTAPKVRLIALKDLIWCYGINTTTQYRVNGIVPAGKTKAFSVKFVCRDQSETVAPATEENTKAIMRLIKKAYPGVITGYSQEIEKVMKSDFAAAVRHVDKHNAL